MAEPSIEAVSLSKSFGSFAAVSNLNLRLEGAKCVGFLGPNGAGKTTTLKLFTDLIRPTSGHALINGADVHKAKKTALAHVGSVIETPEIYASLTPREGLMLICAHRGVPKSERKRKIEEVVEEVKMSEWIDKRIGKFSKGMKQRINVASSLLGDPRVLLLDEPTNGLDPRGMSEVREIVKALKTKNRLIFMSSHLLAEVSEICDEVAMIDHGKLLVYDTLSNVTSRFTKGSNTVEVGLSRPLAAGILEKGIASIPRVDSVQKTDDRSLRILFSGGLDVQERILTELTKMNIGVVSYKTASSALEDVYLNLIKETL
jgi:ABC-2 type transport system ATP-binding protein